MINECGWSISQESSPQKFSDLHFTPELYPGDATWYAQKQRQKWEQHDEKIKAYKKRPESKKAASQTAFVVAPEVTKNCKASKPILCYRASERGTKFYDTMSAVVDELGAKKPIKIGRKGLLRESVYYEQNSEAFDTIKNELGRPKGPKDIRW